MKVKSIAPWSILQYFWPSLSYHLSSRSLFLRERRLRWFGHVEHFWWCNQNSGWYTDWRQAGAGRPKLTWKKLTEKLRKPAVSVSSRQLTLKKGAPGDQVWLWDLLCVQLASYPQRGPLMWMMPLHLHVNQKSDYDDDMFCLFLSGSFTQILLYC